MPIPVAVAVLVGDAAFAERLAAGLRAAGFDVRREASRTAAAVFDGPEAPPREEAGIRIRLASRGPAPADADVVLLYGDLFGDGLLGAFRPALASLADPGAPFDPDRPLAPLHPADLVDAIAAAVRFGGRGVYDLAGPEAPAAVWRARAAAVCRARGWPVAVADVPHPMPPPLAPAHGAAPSPTERGRAAFEWAWRARRSFDATLADQLRAAE